MKIGNLRSLEIKLGLIQTVVLVGVIMGVMLCAFAFGFLSGESVGFERALAGSVANIARFPVSEEPPALESGRDRAAQIYARLKDSKAAGDRGAKEVEPELGKIKSTEEAPVAQLLSSAATKTATASALMKGEKPQETEGGSVLGLDILDKPVDEGVVGADQGVSVLGETGVLQQGSLGSLLAAQGHNLQRDEGRNVLSENSIQRSSSLAEVIPPKPQFVELDSAAESSPKSQTGGLVDRLAEVKSTPRPTPHPQAASPQSTLPPGWYAQVAAPQKLEDANSLAAKLKNSGFPVVVERAEVRGQQYFRVLAGPEKGRTQAEHLVGQLKREKYIGADPFIRMVK